MLVLEGVLAENSRKKIPKRHSNKCWESFWTITDYKISKHEKSFKSYF